MIRQAVENAEKRNEVALFGYYVDFLGYYGIAGSMVRISIDQKPDKPKSNYVIVRLYFYPNQVVEITDLIGCFI